MLEWNHINLSYLIAQSAGCTMSSVYDVKFELLVLTEVGFMRYTGYVR